MLRVTAASREAMSVLGEGTRVGGGGWDDFYAWGAKTGQEKAENA